MKNSLLVYAPLLLLGGLWTWNAYSGPSREADIADMIGTFMADKNGKTDDIDIAWQNLRMFRVAMERVLKEVADGDVSLRHAAAQIIAAAEQWNEPYLFGVDLQEEGATQDERVAWNIYRHFGVLQQNSPSPKNRLLLEHVEQELVEMTGKPLTPAQQVL